MMYQGMDSRNPKAGDTQRRALLNAMARVVGRKGYERAAVDEVVAEADCHPAIFFANFESKRECFWAAYRQLVDLAIDRVAANCAVARPWEERMISGVEALLELCVDNPEAARAAVVEVGKIDAEGQRLHLQTVERFAALISEADPPGEVDLPASAPMLAASGAAGLIRDHLTSGRAEDLPELLPDLSFALLVPFVGAGAAAREMAGVHVASGTANYL